MKPAKLKNYLINKEKKKIFNTFNNNFLLLYYIEYSF